jgi:hypothetical protein
MVCKFLSDVILNSIPFSGFFLSDFTPKESIYLCLCTYIVLAFNGFLKYLFQKLSSPHNFTVPLLGTTCRPSNLSCNLETSSMDMGMPSGHAQTVAFVATYLYLKNKSTFGMYLVIIIMYCRVYLLKHTISQVIIGTMVGIMCGYYFYLM